MTVNFFLGLKICLFFCSKRFWVSSQHRSMTQMIDERLIRLNQNSCCRCDTHGREIWPGCRRNTEHCDAHFCFKNYESWIRPLLIVTLLKHSFHSQLASLKTTSDSKASCQGINWCRDAGSRNDSELHGPENLSQKVARLNPGTGNISILNPPKGLPQNHLK